MLLLPAAIAAFLLVNLLCACVALGVGFAAGVWFYSAKVAKIAKAPAQKQTEAARRAAERAAMAASRVADLAQSIACDVGDHAAKMKVISNGLTEVDRQTGNASEAVFRAMDQMLAANTELQQRLEVAERQLVAQAAEIKAHESEARTDSLTGLSNRRAFDNELKRRHSEWQRNGTPCTLVMLDIDFFKKFNDTHGHQMGDEVLRQVAKVLGVQSRDMDLACRYGGEEFGLILPATDAAKACKFAERIRAAIEESATVYDGKKLKVTCSLGVSAFMADDDAARLIRRADDALYVSKNAGRNCGHWNTGVKHVPINASEESQPAPTATNFDDAEAATSVADAAKPADSTTAPTGTAFVQMLKRRVTESQRFGIPISVMYVRMEEYDVIKRKYGIMIVRQMIDAAAPAFRKVLREMDVIAKLEKGEFVVMLPGSTQPEVLHVIKRMRAAAANCVLPLVDRQLEMSFHYGIAELKANESAQELLARARDAVNAVSNRRATTA